VWILRVVDGKFRKAPVRIEIDQIRPRSIMPQLVEPDIP
jgi:hypothetical protein